MKNGYVIGGLVALVLAVIIGLYSASISNDEVRTRNLATAQETVCKSYFDKMWKIIHEQAGVANEYKDAFKDIYTDIMKGRIGTENSGTLMKWIQERNPEFKTTLYEKLMNSIEAQRDGFFVEQKKLISIKNTHDNLLTLIPSKWIVGSREPLKITIITSAKTNNAYETGEDNDVLYQK